jgi:hypothetical protein
MVMWRYASYASYRAKSPECSLPVKGDLALRKGSESLDDPQQMMQQWLIGSAGWLDDRCMEGRET